MTYILLAFLGFLSCGKEDPTPPPAVAESVVHQPVSVDTTDTTPPPDYRDKFCGKYAMVEKHTKRQGANYQYWSVIDTIFINKAKDTVNALYYHSVSNPNNANYFPFTLFIEKDSSIFFFKGYYELRNPCQYACVGHFLENGDSLTYGYTISASPGHDNLYSATGKKIL